MKTFDSIPVALRRCRHEVAEFAALLAGTPVLEERK
jgi:hypothetical protein